MYYLKLESSSLYGDSDHASRPPVVVGHVFVTRQTLHRSPQLVSRHQTLPAGLYIAPLLTFPEDKTVLVFMSNSLVGNNREI